MKKLNAAIADRKQVSKVTFSQWLRQPSHQSEQAQSNRSTWFYNLLSRLAFCRNLQISPERAKVMLAELDRINYGQEQANLAVAWILYGDWRMKGANPTLELSDFFIGEDRLESVRQSLEGRYFLLTPEEFDQQMNWSYTQGYDKAMTERGAKTPEFYRKQAADKEVDRKSLTNVDPEYRNAVIEWNEMCRRHGLPVFQSDTETSL